MSNNSKTTMNVNLNRSVLADEIRTATPSSSEADRIKSLMNLAAATVTPLAKSAHVQQGVKTGRLGAPTVSKAQGHWEIFSSDVTRCVTQVVVATPLLSVILDIRLPVSQVQSEAMSVLLDHVLAARVYNPEPALAFASSIKEIVGWRGYYHTDGAYTPMFTITPVSCVAETVAEIPSFICKYKTPVGIVSYVIPQSNDIKAILEVITQYWRSWQGTCPRLAPKSLSFGADMTRRITSAQLVTDVHESKADFVARVAKQSL